MKKPPKILFRPFDPSPENEKIPFYLKYLRHHIFAYLGLRPFFAQHTKLEHQILKKYAKGRKTIVEIGVAEGASAYIMRENMAEDGVIYLVDPYPLRRWRWLNLPQKVAQKLLSKSKRGKVEWIEDYSYNVAKKWNKFIDLLFIDGDHSYEGVMRDWQDWSRFVRKKGVVIFHDARVFEGGWTTLNDGPVKAVNYLFRTNSCSNWRIIEEVHSMVVVQRI